MDIAKFYISNCTTCTLKAPRYLASSLKPFISNNFMDRIQVFLILYLSSTRTLKAFVELHVFQVYCRFNDWVAIIYFLKLTLKVWNNSQKTITDSLGIICEHFTKYHVLFGMTAKQPKEVATGLRSSSCSLAGKIPDNQWFSSTFSVTRCIATEIIL